MTPFGLPLQANNEVKRRIVNAPIPVSREVAQEAVKVARRILNGSVGIVQGAHEMSAIQLYSGHVQQPLDTDYLHFGRINSETRHLPVGSVRRHWNAEALVRKDVEIREAEQRFRDSALKAAQAIVDRLENA